MFKMNRNKILMNVGKQSHLKVDDLRVLNLRCVIVLSVFGMLTCFGDVADSMWSSFGTDTAVYQNEFESLRKPKKEVAPNEKTKEIEGGGYASLRESEKLRLFRLAKCANAAYPNVPLPEGYRAFSEEEWMRCKLLRFSGNGLYNEDGYLNYASGLRARLMVHKVSGDVVVAWSGCDFPDNVKDSAIDGCTALRQYAGKMNGQFNQALKIFQGILTTMLGRIEVVGHSLGGALTTYVVAASSDIDNRITGATFNGLGLSNSIQKKLTVKQRQKTEKLLVNVKGSQDPVFKMGWTRHYGIVYDIPQDYGIHWLKAHSIEELIVRMNLSGAESSVAGDFWNNISL